MLAILAQATQPAVDAIELLNRVDSFYQSAWVKLILAISIGGVIVGVAVPMVVQRLQNASIDRAEKRVWQDWAKESERLQREMARLLEKVKGAEGKIADAEGRLLASVKESEKRALESVSSAEEELRKYTRQKVAMALGDALRHVVLTVDLPSSGGWPGVVAMRSAKQAVIAGSVLAGSIEKMEAMLRIALRAFGRLKGNPRDAGAAHLDWFREELGDLEKCIAEEGVKLSDKGKELLENLRVVLADWPVGGKEASEGKSK